LFIFVRKNTHCSVTPDRLFAGDFSSPPLRPPFFAPRGDILHAIAVEKSRPLCCAAQGRAGIKRGLVQKI